MAKRYKSSFAVPSGFAFSARVGKSARSADAGEVAGRRTSAPSLPERRELVSTGRKQAA